MKLKTNKILTINSGSSSIKFALFDAAANLKKELYGKIERIGFSDSVLTYQDLVTDKTGKHIIGNTSAVKFLIDWLKEYIDIASISAIGHRVVHGMKHVEPELVSLELLNELNRISAYDPDHLPQEIEMIELFRKLYPDTLQLACFDTFFHAAMPHIAKLLPIPRRYDAMSIQRYGFHGLSYAYLMEELAHVAGNETTKGKIILTHLGNGANLAAVKDGKSIDTSMGFTPTSGLVMGTRTGDLEPGVAWFLMQHRLTYRRTNHAQLHVRGYKGNGTTTTAFDMVVMNDLDRFHLVCDVIDRVRGLGSKAAYTKQYVQNKLIDHKVYIEIHGEDMTEIRNWKWNEDAGEQRI